MKNGQDACKSRGRKKFTSQSTPSHTYDLEQQHVAFFGLFFALWLHVWQPDRFFRILCVRQRDFEILYKVKHRKKDCLTGDPKRIRTRVAGMASDTHDHCATATDRQN